MQQITHVLLLEQVLPQDQLPPMEQSLKLHAYQDIIYSVEFVPHAELVF
jgi:hypothetical protein